MYEAHLSADPTAQSRALRPATFALTVCFAAGAILGVQISDDVAVSAFAFSLLVGAPFWQMIAVAAGGLRLMRLARLPRPIMKRDGGTVRSGTMAAPQADMAA